VSSGRNGAIAGGVGVLVLSPVLLLAAIAGAVQPAALTCALPVPTPSGSSRPSPAPSAPLPGAPNLTPEQWQIVQTTAGVAAAKGVENTQALTAIFAAGLVESGLRNLPYGDRDSLGVWQERPSQGWGTAAQIMDVSYAAGSWFDHMLAVSGWQTMPPGDLAQAVEVSAFPDRYAAQVPEATAIAAAVLGGTVPACTGPVGSARGLAVLQAAITQLGVPYQWGAESPGQAFDCSGLTAWAYSTVGVTLPHNSGAQSVAMPHYPLDQAQAGDILFFGSPIHHVGVYVSPGQMIDAPHTGAVVQYEDYSGWSDLLPYVGRPS